MDTYPYTAPGQGYYNLPNLQKVSSSKLRKRVREKGTPVTVRVSGGRNDRKWNQEKPTEKQTCLLMTRKDTGSAPGLRPHAPKLLLLVNAHSMKPELAESHCP